MQGTENSPQRSAGSVEEQKFMQENEFNSHKITDDLSSHYKMTLLPKLQQVKNSGFTAKHT